MAATDGEMQTLSLAEREYGNAKDHHAATDGEMQTLSLEGDRLAVKATPAAGGALWVSRTGRNGAATGAPVRVSEFLGAPVYDLGTRPWEPSMEDGVLTLAVLWRSILLEKRISLDPSEPALLLEYTFINGGEVLERPAFGMSLRVGDARARCHVPGAEGPRRIEAGAVRETRYVRPAEPWAALDWRGGLAVASFPPGVLDAVEISAASTECSLTALVYTIGLSPGCEARFTCRLRFGRSGQDRAPEMGDARHDGLASEYGPATPARRQRAAAFDRKSEHETHDHAAVAQAAANLRARADGLVLHAPRRLETLQRLADGGITIDQALEQIALE